MNSSNVVVFFAHANSGTTLKAGAPAFFATDTGELLEAPTRFLRSRFVQSGKAASKLTWRKAAYALATWWDFLDALKLEWALAIKDDLLKYRDIYLESISPSTGQTYEPSTVSYRMSVIGEFYRHQAARGEYAGTILQPTEGSVAIDDSNLRSPDHPYASSTKRQDIDYDIFPKANSANLIRPYTQKDWACLMKSLGSLPSAGGTGESCRDALLLTVALVLGIRISELTGLTSYQFLSITDATLFSQHHLEVKGKGSKKRMITCPGWIVLEINLYIAVERESAARTLGKRISAALFLTSLGSKRPGRPLSNRRIQEIHNHACIRAGLLRPVMRDLDGSGIPKPVNVARYRVHDLRHTYAVWTYHSLKQAGDPEPWKLIQAQLGHRHLATTLNTYLRYVAIFDKSVPVADLRTIMNW